MADRRLWPALLVLVALLLVTNPLWLFPHEGETLHTYERSTVTVENGTLSYHGRDVGRFDDENDLTAVGCQAIDDADNQLRTCALDQYLVDHPPVSAAQSLKDDGSAEFVRLGDRYYRRLVHENESSGTLALDVERVSPDVVLAESAYDISSVTAVRDSHDVRLRVLVSGETERSYTDLSDYGLGLLYERNGSYYTVVRTGASVVDHGPLVHNLRYEVPRYLLVALGVVVLLVAFLTRPD